MHKIMCTTKINIRLTKLFEDCFFVLLKAFGTLLFKVFYRVQVENRENIPVKGPLIVAANHVSYMDPIVLQVVFPRHISFMMTEIFYEGRGKWFFKLMRCICVRQKGPNTSSLRQAMNVLKEDGVLGIFPEGGVSSDGTFQQAIPGVGFLAMKGNAPVLPAFISGTYRALPKGSVIPRFTRIKVQFGKIIEFDTRLINKEKKKEILDFTQEIMDKIACLSGKSNKEK